MKSNSEIVIYKNESDDIKIDVLLEDETVWLSRHQMAKLFNRDIKTIHHSNAS